MRAPFELGCRPERSMSTPAFVSSSLYFIMAEMSFSSGMTPASESLLALTIIMNRIAPSPSLSGCRNLGFRSPPQGRTGGRRADSAGEKSLPVTAARPRPPGGTEKQLPGFYGMLAHHCHADPGGMARKH